MTSINRTSDTIRDKYPDKVPVICKPAKWSHLQPTDKQRFLVSREWTLGQFLYCLRRYIKLNQGQTIFIFINGITQNTSTLMSVIDQDHRHEDGFVYMQYTEEECFG